MDKQRIKVGIVGCGEIAQIMHIPYLKEMEEQYELVALCARSKKLAETLAEKYQVKKIFNDYEDMLEMRNLDAVLILNMDHAPVAMKAANAKKHIFVEKPIAFTLKEADDMINACNQNGVKLMVGYMKIYDPAFQYAKKLFEKMDYKLIRSHDYLHYNPLIVEELYNILKFDDVPYDPMTMLVDVLSKRIGPDLFCGDEDILVAYIFLLMGGSHDLSILTEAFGYPKKVLWTDIWKHEGSGPEGKKNGLGVFGHYVSSIFDYGKNRRCIFEFGGTARKWMDEDLVAFGTNETVKISYPSPYIKNTPAEVERTYMRDGEIHKEVANISYEEAFKRELKHFHDCIVDNKEPITNGEMGRKILHLCRSIVKKYLERKDRYIMRENI